MHPLETVTLMSDLFQGLARGEPKEAALRSAQLQRIAAVRASGALRQPFGQAEDGVLRIDLRLLGPGVERHHDGFRLQRRIAAAVFQTGSSSDRMASVCFQKSSGVGIEPTASWFKARQPTA